MSKDLNQKEHWDAKHARGEHEKYGYNPSDFAQEIIDTLSKDDRVLELGCGIGHDSKFIGQRVNKLLATDLSKVVIEQNIDKYRELNSIQFKQMDILELPWEFDNGAFDVVYSHLALHYFSKTDTKKVFKEIHRVLKPSDRLLFVCKSIKDRYYGKGEELEPDMFLYKGHVRHLFSEEFVEYLTEGLFDIEELNYDTNNFFGKESEFIKCKATRK